MKNLSSERNLFVAGGDPFVLGLTDYGSFLDCTRKRLLDQGYFLIENVSLFLRCAEVDKWCEQNLKGKYFITEPQCLFQYREDMVKFGLTWV